MKVCQRNLVINLKSAKALGLTISSPVPPETRRVGTFPNTEPKSLRICSASNQPDVMQTRLLIPVLVGSVLSFAAYAWAGSPTDRSARLHRSSAQGLGESRAHLPRALYRGSEVCRRGVGSVRTAKRALGPHWAQRTPAEREEFLKLFAGLLEQTYISRIGEYGGEQITYAGEQIEGERAIVRARITTKKGSEVPVASRLLQKKDRWLIYDVLVENIWLDMYQVARIGVRQLEPSSDAKPVLQQQLWGPLRSQSYVR